MKENEKICSNCKTKIDKINYTAVMTEQWVWDGEKWECCARNSLTKDPEQNVYCTECDSVIGTGKDFGF